MSHRETQQVEASKDFFISYSNTDIKWAEWIAWQLEEAGYTTVIQAWDFRSGGNFVLDMDMATKVGRRTIAVLSPDYLTSGFTAAEWAVAFERDPKGEQGLLVPVRVRSCDVQGLLAPISYIDLVDLDSPSARSSLLTGVQQERAKPRKAPAYPGPTPRFPGTLPEIWMVPFRRNRLFTGREEILCQLHGALQKAGKPVAVTQAITGLGGIGKTQTVVEYVYRYFHEYQAILWMQADSLSRITSSFLAMAQTLGLFEQEVKEADQIISAVQQWYRSHSGWLLIVDNADELELVQHFLPEGNGQILLTTRSQVTRGITDEDLPLDMMNEEEGTLLLLRCTKVRPNVSLETVSEEERACAKRIVEELGGLPLALDQAGAYVEETKCDLSNYLALYQQHRSRLLKHRGTLANDYPESVATTWLLSFEKVEQTNPAAANLLRLCTFLHPDAIPEELLIRGAFWLFKKLPIFSSFLWPLEERFRALFSLKSTKDEAALSFKLDALIATLLRYSLIQRKTEEKMLSIHRLVQAVLRDTIDRQMYQWWLWQSLQAINAVFPVAEFQNWSQCERYLSHAQACIAFVEEKKRTSVVAVPLLKSVGNYLLQQGRFAEAELVLQRGLVISEKWFGPTHLLTASYLNDLAVVYLYEEKYEMAEPMLQRALSIDEKRLGQAHHSIIPEINNLANLYRKNGKYEQAESMFKRALNISEHRLRPKYSDIIGSLGGLALLYREQGKLAEAELLLQRALDICERELGPTHSDTATSLNNLVWWLLRPSVHIIDSSVIVLAT